MIKELKRIRVENNFIKYINETHPMKGGKKTVLYSHGTRFVFWTSDTTRTIKVYYNNIVETFKGEIPDNYIELIEKQINTKGYAIIEHGKEE